MASDFPITRKPSPEFFNQTIYKAQIKSEFENGVVQSRAAATVHKHIFNIGWNAITETELQSLYTHFTASVGDTFSWTHPTTSTIYTVRYSEDQLPEASYMGNLSDEDAWTIGPIILEEA